LSNSFKFFAKNKRLFIKQIFILNGLSMLAECHKGIISGLFLNTKLVLILMKIFLKKKYPWNRIE